MPTLNDSRLLVRFVALGMCIALGVVVGALIASLRDIGSSSTPWLLVVGFAIELLVCLTMVVVSRRGDARLRSGIERCTRELIEGTAPSTARVPARVVRRRRERRRAGGVIDGPGRPFGRLDRARAVAVLEALPPDGGPRRVGVLVPAPADGALTVGSVHLVRLHPGDREAAVLDVGVEQAELDAARRDPRWTSAALPTDGSVAGGWVGAVGIGSVGLLLGVVVALVATAI